MSSQERWLPISVMLSMYGSRINSKLLFRYPYAENEHFPPLSYTQMTASTLQLNKQQLGTPSEDSEDCCGTSKNEIEQLESFSDELLGHIDHTIKSTGAEKGRGSSGNNFYCHDIQVRGTQEIAQRKVQSRRLVVDTVDQLQGADR